MKKLLVLVALLALGAGLLFVIRSFSEEIE